MFNYTRLGRPLTLFRCRGDGGDADDAQLTAVDGDGADDSANGDGDDGAPKQRHLSHRPGSTRSHSGANGGRRSPGMASHCS